MDGGPSLAAPRPSSHSRPSTGHKHPINGSTTSGSSGDEPFLDFGTTAITNANLLHCLAVIEQKANELLIANFANSLPKRTGNGDEKDAANNAASTQEGGSSTGSMTGGLGGLVPQTQQQQASIGGLLGQGPQPPVGTISIVAPSTGDDHDTDDILSEDDEKPMTREELTQKTLRGLSRRTGPAVTSVKTAKSKRRERF